MELYRFEHYVSDSDEDGDDGGLGEDENAGHMFTTDWWVWFFCSSDDL